MAKVIAPFLIKGTIDDINFVVTAGGGNYARIKGQTGVTAEEFKNNPIYDRIRNQGKEFGQCVKKAAIFRQLAARFTSVAKDGSIAGRTNALLFEILKEDTSQPIGQRNLAEGLKTANGKDLLLLFESNKLRSIQKVLKTKEQSDPINQTITLTKFKASKHLDWPKEATHVHLAIATAHWDFENDTHDTCYSEEKILEKESKKQNIILSTDKPQGNNLYLTFLFIGFSKQEQKRHKMLHRKNNTTTIIAHQTP